LNKENFKNSDLAKCLPKLNIEHEIIYENKEGLPTIYNRYLTYSHANKILVFVHHDVIIEDLFFVEKLNEAIQLFDVVGLVGTAGPLQIKSPSGWHLVGNRANFSGAVAHFAPNQSTERWMSSFGVTPKKCELLDGVFLALNMEKVLATDVMFDEDFSFHHYDMSFCIRATKAKLKLGTYPIWTTHRGLGDSIDTDAWRESDKRFVSKYGN